MDTNNPIEPAQGFSPNAGEEDDLNLAELLRTALSHARLIVLTTLGFAVLGLLYAFLWPKTYEASTTVKVPDLSQTAQGMLRQLVPFNGTGDPIETYVEVCKSRTVALDVIRDLGLAALPEYQGKTPQEIAESLLKGAVQVSNVKTSNVISISARSHDPKLAADLANAWARDFISVNLDLSHKGADSRRDFLETEAQKMRQRLENPSLGLNDQSKADEVIYAQLLQELQQAEMASKVNDAGIVVLDPALVPEKPVSPRRALSLALALLLGLFLGVQGAFLLERWQDRVKDVEKLKAFTGLANYAVVPDLREDYPKGMGRPDPSERFSVKYLINNPVFTHSYYRESFKVLRTNLTLARADRPLRAVSILSAGPEAGKTLANSNLSISFAQSGKKTLLVDADLRKPAVRKAFGLENGMETGLPLALTGQKPWRQMTRPSGVENLDLLPNTVLPPNPAELLSSEAMVRLAGEMKDAYDIVVFDGAPILPVTDSVVMATLLDGVVLLARFDHARLHGLKLAVEHLRRVGASVVGTVLNGVPLKRRLYGYGYRYGYGYGEASAKDGARDKAKR